MEKHYIQTHEKMNTFRYVLSKFFADILLDSVTNLSVYAIPIMNKLMFPNI